LEFKSPYVSYPVYTSLGGDSDFNVPAAIITAIDSIISGMSLTPKSEIPYTTPLPFKKLVRGF
jgi:hypothetical protein